MVTAVSVGVAPLIGTTDCARVGMNPPIATMRHKTPQKQFFNKRALFIIHLHSIVGCCFFLVDCRTRSGLEWLFRSRGFFGFLPYLITRKACNNWLNLLVCPVIIRKYGNFRRG